MNINASERQQGVVSDTETVMENLRLETNNPNNGSNNDGDGAAENQQQPNEADEGHHNPQMPQNVGHPVANQARSSNQYDHGEQQRFYPPSNPYPYPNQHPAPQQYPFQEPRLIPGTFPVHYPSHPPSHPQGNAAGMLQFYEAQMRDHAAAYASAAAAAAVAAANIANSAVSTPTSGSYMPISLPHPPGLFPPSVQLSETCSSLAFQQLSLSPHNSYGEDQQQYQASNDRRRKRQPRNNDPNHPFQHYHSSIADTGRALENTAHGNEKRGRRRQRFWNEFADNSSDSTTARNHKRSSSRNNNNSHHNPRRRNRKAAMPASSSSDGGGGKKKQRQITDESLLGKTGASALYEWCDKRRVTPIFECVAVAQHPDLEKECQEDDNQKPAAKRDGDEIGQEVDRDEEKEGDDDSRRGAFDQKIYETTVLVDGIEMGKGRGATKTASKHEASRNALQVLLPGVEFDPYSGIIFKVPIDQGRSSASRLNQWSSNAVVHNNGASGRSGASTKVLSTCLDDLAPTLAKRLAIGQANDDSDEEDSKSSDPSRLRASSRRGTWPYVYPGTSTTSDDEDANTYFASRGASVCSSLLHAMVQIDDRLSDPPEYKYEVATVSDASCTIVGNSKVKQRAWAGVPIDSTSTGFPRGVFYCTGMLNIRVPSSASSKEPSQNNASIPRESFQLLRGMGSGATKREARHVAAAKLLALLFPHCKGMAQVKEAAENAREEYAASRALKQQQSRKVMRLLVESTRKPTENDDCPAFCFAMASEKSRSIPSLIEVGLVNMVGGFYGSDIHLRNESAVKDESGQMRQLSRQQQLEEKVTAALQNLNEHDEEGRSLPDEVTVDDVGRTVLRRASVDDMSWIEELFAANGKRSRIACCSPLNVLGIDKEGNFAAMQLWSSSTIILLLCRAIAPHEDPPLGCAVLTLGFSMRNGKTLRLAQLASQSHLPRERFLECLTSFANSMECCLETSFQLETQRTALREECVRCILGSHLPSLPTTSGVSRNETAYISHRKTSRPLEDTFAQPVLQSVQEEEGEGCEESDTSQGKEDKSQDKPSKRSRVE